MKGMCPFEICVPKTAHVSKMSSERCQREPEGNTDASGSKPPTKKRDNACRNWCFTLFLSDEEGAKDNDLTPEELFHRLLKRCDEFTYQVERCPKTQKLHYQGVFSLEVKERRSTAKEVIGDNRAHLENAKGWKASWNYCRKAESRVAGPWDHKTEWMEVIETLNPWQEELASLLREKPDDRTIHWYWEHVGNSGKSAMADWLVARMGACEVLGKYSDAAYALKPNPKIVIWDLTREREQHLSYSMMESVKNGKVFSSKYKSEMKRFKKPHVVVFANFYPDTDRMSADRWHIVDLGKEKRYV